MTRLVFLSPANAAPDVAIGSPIAHALGPGVTDVSHLGKLELRGELAGVEPAAGEELLPLGPSRALLVTAGSPAAAAARLAGARVRVYDQTAALAAFEFDGEDVLRRLTDLGSAQLPAVGAIARGTWALIEARAGERFRVFVPQELGHHVVEVVVDTLRGLGR
jgi:hypothetical protein